MTICGTTHSVSPYPLEEYSSTNNICRNPEGGIQLMEGAGCTLLSQGYG